MGFKIFDDVKLDPEKTFYLKMKCNLLVKFQHIKYQLFTACFTKNLQENNSLLMNKTQFLFVFQILVEHLCLSCLRKNSINLSIALRLIYYPGFPY